MSVVWAIVYNLEKHGGYGFVERGCLWPLMGRVYQMVSAGYTSLTDLLILLLKSAYNQ